MPARLASPSPSRLAAALGAAALAALACLVPTARRAAAQEELGLEGDIHVKTGGPVYQCLVGDTVFFDKIPEAVRAREKVEKRSRASNDVEKIEGTFKLDLEAPDVLSEPKPAEVTCRFKLKDGSEWRLAPAQDSVVERGSMSPGSTVYAFGPSNKGTPAEPRQRMILRLRGKARIDKDNKSVVGDAPFNIVVGFVTRDRDTGKYKGGYEENFDLWEVKVIVPETFDIPGYGKGLSLVYTGAVVSK